MIEIEKAEMLARLTRALMAEWERQNEATFGGSLKPPVVEIRESRSRLGQWDGERRALFLSEKCVLDLSWRAVVEVLRHEMAHQYVHEVLRTGAEGEPAHGGAFQSVCSQRGIDARAAGVPDAGLTGEEERAADRAKKLLALSHSDNANEARAALAAAHAVMRRAGLSEDDVLSEAREEGIGVRMLGAILLRRQDHDFRVAGILSEFFRVKLLWIHTADPRTGERGMQLEACGRPGNLDMAEHVHGFLHAAVDRLAPAKGRRLAWKASFMRGFHDSLAAEEEREKARLARAEPGLVLVTGADSEVRAFHLRRYPRRRSSKLQGWGFDLGGYQAGKAARMQRPLAASSPKLLPPRSR